MDWIKVRDIHSHVYPDIPTVKENGVWIDIYKLIPSKAKDTAWRIAKGHLDYVNRRYALGGLTREQYKERLRIGHLERNVALARLKALFNFDREESYIIWSASKVILKKKWIEPLRYFDFEGLKVTSFGRAEEYLLQHYGENYRTWPEDEARRVGLNRIEYEE